MARTFAQVGGVGIGSVVNPDVQDSGSTVDVVPTIGDSSDSESCAITETEIAERAAVLTSTLPAPVLRYQNSMRDMIAFGGGEVRHGIFVTRPGVEILAQTALTKSGNNFHTSLGLSTHATDPCFAGATLLIAGASLECCLEFIAHAARIARTTSSAAIRPEQKCAAMDHPLYAVTPDTEESMLEKMACLLDFAELREKQRSRYRPYQRWVGGREVFNAYSPAQKTLAMTYAMPLSGFDWLLRGRLPVDGNENHVRQVARSMCEALHVLYPDIIQKPESYISQGQASRYAQKGNQGDELTKKIHWRYILEAAGGEGRGRKITKPGVLMLAESELTEAARKLFKQLNIDTDGSDSEQLIQFNSCITYQSFPQKSGSARVFNERIIRDLQHLSVAASHEVSFFLAGIDKENLNMLARFGVCAIPEYAGQFPKGKTAVVFTTNLRQLHQLLLQASANPANAELTGICRELADVMQKKNGLVIRKQEEYFKTSSPQTHQH